MSLVGIGDNTGGLDQAQMIAENLNERHAKIKERAEELAAMLARLPATAEDEDTANRLSEAVRQCTEFLKSLEGTRVDEKEPYLSGGRAVDGWAQALAKGVNATKARAAAVRTAYDVEIENRERARRAEEARKAKEEADRLAAKAKAEADKLLAQKRASEQQRAKAAAAAQAAEQAEHEAEAARQDARASTADLTRTRTTAGVTTSLKSEWRHEVIDSKKVPRKYCVHSDALLRASVKAASQEDGTNSLLDAQGESTIPGVRIYLHRHSQVR